MPAERRYVDETSRVGEDAGELGGECCHADLLRQACFGVPEASRSRVPQRNALCIEVAGAAGDRPRRC